MKPSVWEKDKEIVGSLVVLKALRKNNSWKNLLQWSKGIVSSAWNVRSKFFVCLFVPFIKVILTCNGDCHTDDDTDGLGQLHTWSPELNKNDKTWRASSINAITCE